MDISDEIARHKNTHLMEWLKEGYGHCQHGSKDWCQGYLNSAHDYILALETALGDMEMVGWRYRFEPDLRWHLEEYENTIPKKSEFPRIEVEPLYAFKEPVT